MQNVLFSPSSNFHYSTSNTVILSYILLLDLTHTILISLVYCNSLLERRNRLFFRCKLYLAILFRVYMLTDHQIHKTRSFNFSKVEVRKSYFFWICIFLNLIFYPNNYLQTCVTAIVYESLNMPIFNLLNMWLKINENFDNSNQYGFIYISS